MRILTASCLAASALLAVPAAAKPPAPPAAPEDPQVAMYRLEALGMCIADQPPAVDFDPRRDNMMADCDCAIERFMAGRPVASLPEMRRGQSPEQLGDLFRQCRTERLAGLGGPAAAPAPPPAPAAPSAVPAAVPTAAPPAEAAKPEGPDLMARLRDLGIPRWALPLLALLAGLLVAVMAIGRRRRGRDDLLGPPPAMRGPVE